MTDTVAQNPSTPPPAQANPTNDPAVTNTGDSSTTQLIGSDQGGGAQQQPQPNAAQPAAGTQAQAPAGAQPNAEVQQAAQPQAAPKPPSPTRRLLDRAREISNELIPTPYKTTIDPNTGETTRTQAPLSGRALSMSLILEALQGGLAGAGEHGPGATGKAAEAGLQQGEKIAQQRQDQQAQLDQQAQTDLRNRQQVITNLLQTRQLALSLGRQSMDEAKQSVDADSSEWQKHQDDPSSILGQGLSHDGAYGMLNKLPMGTAQVLITGVKPRTDPKTGALVYQLPNGSIAESTTPGAYVAPDFIYAVVKPTMKQSLTDNDGNYVDGVKSAVDRGYLQITKDANGKLPANYQVDGKAYQAATLGNKIANTVQTDVDKSRANLGMEPLSIDKDLANDPNLRQALIQYNSVLNDPNGNHTKAFEAVASGPYKSAAGTIQNWYGGGQAVKHLDAMQAQHEYNQSVLNGDKPIVSADDAQQAMASDDGRVRQMGRKRLQAIDQAEAQRKSQDAYATAGAEVWKEERVAQFKNHLVQQGGADNPFYNEAPDPKTGVKENYVNSLPDGAMLRSVIAGLAPLNPRSKDYTTILNHAEIATNGQFSPEKYEGYQTLVKSIGGKQGDYFGSGSTALDHLADAANSADRTAVTPLVGWAARKGMLGAKAQDKANTFDQDRHIAASELGKAVEGKVLTQGEADQWQTRVESWTPAEFRSKAKPLANLLLQRMKEKQQQLQQLAPAGRVTGLRGMSPSGVASYNAITGNKIDPAEMQLDNPNQNNNLAPIQSTPPAQPPDAAGKMRFSDGNVYYVDKNKKPLARAE